MCSHKRTPIFLGLTDPSMFVIWKKKKKKKKSPSYTENEQKLQWMMMKKTHWENNSKIPQMLA